MDRKILEKIKKCLRLAKSSNANEAATAMRQAQKLMEMHGITSDDISISDVETATSNAGAGKNPPTYIAMLANMIADAFGAELVYGAKHDGYKWSGYFEFYGLGGNAEIAGYAFEVLGRHLKRDRSNYMSGLNKRIKRTTKVRRGDLYAEAWIYAVAMQVSKHQRSESENSIIAAYKAKRWDKPLENLKTRDNTKGRSNHDYDALRQGGRDGQKVSFHQGVKGDKRTGIGRDKLALAHSAGGY
ncbi:DUF2786 domain-containing protein [Nitrincola iocasae]|uniref:DUF2786 domain-containing protein n=1 Tax=Nitrincola iocasae TaxID=2614693 RepID=A0A5J6LBP2_9GAMM|nr:DUF2786 domain-containing protein [Nitrincola iocasae]QEW05622.1 DUF2786 domain-containing protein [Nitrincola iocasae]